MKTLQSFKEIVISEKESKNVLGGIGYPVSGSMTYGGSLFSYSGEMIASTSTATSLTTVAPSPTCTVDFCGSVSFDGINSIVYGLTNFSC